jgi:ADP-ribose pyrophosphatase YjhB (NUDIX family)
VVVSEYVRRLRACVGHDLLLLPSVSLLVLDGPRLLLVRHAGLGDDWGLVGGAIEVGESPAEAAVREAREEIGVDVELTRLVDVLAGPDYEVTYPNGDRVAYVATVYTARIPTGAPVADGAELSDAAWFDLAGVGRLPLSRFTRALLTATGQLDRTAWSRRGAGDSPAAAVQP